MTERASGFKRMVVGLPHSMANQAAVNAAADLAEFLDIELLAAFLTDESLHSLAGYPLARELRLLDRGWQAIDLGQITEELDRAVGVARRRFADAVRSRAVNARFDVLSVEAMMTSPFRADDIVAIIEPSHPAERITRQFTGLLQAALEAAGAVLMLPQRIAHRTGPVVALTARPDEVNARVACEIAAALKEDLIVVTRPGDVLSADFVSRAGRLGVHYRQIGYSGSTADLVATDLSALHPKERLRVVDRSAIPDDAAQLFTMAREVPLLVIDPERIRFPAEPDRDIR